MTTHEENPKHYELYLSGSWELSKGNIADAFKFLSASVELYPHFKTYEQLYLVLTRLERPEEAFTMIEQAYTLNPNNSKTATLYAESLIDRERIAEAKAVLVSLLKRHNTYGPAQRLLKSLSDNE